MDQQLVNNASGGALSRVRLSIDQTAAKIGVHRSTVYRLLREDPDFPPLIALTSKLRFFYEDDVDDWLAKRQPVERSATKQSPKQK